MEGDARKGRATSGKDEEDKTIARSYHNTVLSGKLRQALSSPFPPEASLTYLVAPSALASPTRPAWRPLSQRSICCISLALISRALQTPNIFVRTTWAKTRGISEFQLLPITPRHSADKITVRQRPTAPEGVAYQLAD